jgi:hypothetical protein
MSGDLLIPLNTLKATHPEAYSEHVKKYKGREELLQKNIPILNCLWNDVLHISPINPQILLDTWRSEGLFEFSGIKKSIEVFKIPVKLLNDETTVCFQSFNYDFHSKDPNLFKYWNFNQSEFKEQNEVEPKQVEIWKNDIENKRPLFWYSHTMHILAQQTIDTRSCELIVCQ